MSASSSLTPLNLALNGTAGLNGYLRLENAGSSSTGFQISSDIGTATPIRLNGIADGTLVADAVNFGQLTALTQIVDAITSGITWVNSVELAFVREPLGDGTGMDAPADTNFFAVQDVDTNFPSIDGVIFSTLPENTRVAVMIPRWCEYNGVWVRNSEVYSSTVAFTALYNRADDFRTPLTVANVSGKAFIVKRGTVYGDTAWVQTADVGGTIPLGAATDRLEFVQISQQAITAGVNIGLVNREISLEPAITLAGNGSNHNTLTITEGDISVLNGSVVSPVFNTISDERKKDIIGHVIDASDAVNRIEPIYYTMKAGNNKRKHCGVSAQQVREVTPDAVIEDKDGFLSVDYHYFTGLLLAHNKQLGKAVDELWAEVSELKRQRS